MGDREKKGPICKKVVIFRLCNVSKYPKIFHPLWKFDHAKANPLVLKTIRFPLPNFWKKKWTHEKENMICNCTAKVRIGGKMTRKWGSFLEGERERDWMLFREVRVWVFWEREREKLSVKWVLGGSGHQPLLFFSWASSSSSVSGFFFICGVVEEIAVDLWFWECFWRWVLLDLADAGPWKLSSSFFLFWG